MSCENIIGVRVLCEIGVKLLFQWFLRIHLRVSVGVLNVFAREVWSATGVRRGPLKSGFRLFTK